MDSCGPAGMWYEPHPEKEKKWQEFRQRVEKRNLAELDTVLEEILDRNPNFFKQVEDLIEAIKIKSQPK